MPERSASSAGKEAAGALNLISTVLGSSTSTPSTTLMSALSVDLGLKSAVAAAACVPAALVAAPAAVVAAPPAAPVALAPLLLLSSLPPQASASTPSASSSQTAALVIVRDVMVDFPSSYGPLSGA